MKILNDPYISTEMTILNTQADRVTDDIENTILNLKVEEEGILYFNKK